MAARGLHGGWAGSHAARVRAAAGPALRRAETGARRLLRRGTGGRAGEIHGGRPGKGARRSVMSSSGTRALASVLLALGAVAWAPQTRDWILSREITGPVDVFSYFPLQVGNRWVYQYEYKTGDPERPNVQRWTSEVV